MKKKLCMKDFPSQMSTDESSELFESFIVGVFTAGKVLARVHEKPKDDQT